MVLLVVVLGYQFEWLSLRRNGVVGHQSEWLNPPEQRWAGNRSADHVLLLSSLLPRRVAPHCIQPGKGRPSMLPWNEVGCFWSEQLHPEVGELP